MDVAGRFNADVFSVTFLQREFCGRKPCWAWLCWVQASNQPCWLGQMSFIVIIILYQQSKGIDFSQASYVLTQPVGSCPAEPFRTQS